MYKSSKKPKIRPLGWTTQVEVGRLLKAGANPRTGDMSLYRSNKDFDYNISLDKSIAVQENTFSFREGYELPCWSLAALIDIFPRQIMFGHTKLYFMIAESCSNTLLVGYCDMQSQEMVEPLTAEGGYLVASCVDLYENLMKFKNEGKVVTP